MSSVSSPVGKNTLSPREIEVTRRPGGRRASRSILPDSGDPALTVT